jgi:phosphoglycerate dehydrogenase-like enzyme
MFESRVLRNVFGSEPDEETGGCRQLHNNEFMVCTPHYARVIKSRRMRCAVTVVRQGRGEVCRRF